MRRIENLILGGGFTALELARRLDSSVIVSVDLGGLIRNFTVDNFSFDLGGHVYTTDDPYIENLIRDAGGVYHDERRAYYANDFDDWIPYPVQSHAERLGITLTPEPNDNPQNFAEYVTSVFGSAFYEQFMRPFNQRVWTTPPHLLAKDWIYGRIKMPSETDAPQKWGMNARFLYAPGADITRRMLRAVKNMTPIRGVIVADIDYKEHRIVTTTGSLTYKNLFDTAGIAFSEPKYNRILPRNYVLSVGVGFRKTLPLDFHWVYGKLGEPVHRVTLLSRYHKKNAPAGCDSLLLEIPLLDLNDASNEIRWLLSDHISEFSKIGIALSLLERARIMKVDDLRQFDPIVFFSRVSRGYPIPVIGAREAVAQRKRQMLEHDAYSLGRWGSHGYFNLQHLVRDVDETMDMLENRELYKDDRDHPYFTASFYYKS